MRRFAEILAMLAVVATILAPTLSSKHNTKHALTWTHLSSRNGDLPAPNSGTQQTATLVLDIDKDGRNDFVITERTAAPAAVWYRRTATGWAKYIIEDKPLHIEAGGAFADVDGDGDLDLIFGGDWMLNEVWWWENPYPHFDPAVPWKRHIIKNSGGTQHHDQIVGDFDGDGKLELVFWNQGSNELCLAPFPADPRHTEPWPYTVIYKSPSKSEGLAAADIDGDGKIDLIGGGRWFKYEGGTKFTPYVIDDTMRDSRAAAGTLIRGSRAQVVFVVGDGVSRLKWYESRGDPRPQESWVARDLLGRDVIHGHSLALADLDGDGNLDIFCAEMGKWTESAPQPDNPHPHMWIFFGDGKGHFAATEMATGFGNHESRVADLDSDGRLDILMKPYNWDTPRVDVWLNRGERK